MSHRHVNEVTENVFHNAKLNSANSVKTRRTGTVHIPPTRHLLPVSRSGSWSGSPPNINHLFISPLPTFPGKFHANPFRRFCSKFLTDWQKETENLALCGTDGWLLLSGFQLLVTLTLNPVIRHTITHHSSTSIHTPNFSWNRTNFLWRDVQTDVPSDGQTFPRLMLLGRLEGVDLTHNDDYISSLAEAMTARDKYNKIIFENCTHLNCYHN